MSAVANYAGMTVQQVKEAVEKSVKDAEGPLRQLTGVVTSKAAEALEKAKALVPKTAVDQLTSSFNVINLKVNEVYQFKQEDYVNYAAVTKDAMKGWGLEMLHFDYLGYSKDVMATNGDAIQQKFAASVADLEKARKVLQEQVAARTAEGKEAAGDAAEALKAQIAKVTEATNTLAADAAKFVEEKKASLPARAEKSVDFIVGAPKAMKALADEVKDKADIDSSKKVLDNASNLAVAVKEVLYGYVVHASAQ